MFVVNDPVGATKKMSSTTKSVSRGPGEDRARVLVFEDDPSRSAELVEALAASGYRAARAQPSMWLGNKEKLAEHAELAVAGARTYAANAWGGSLRALAAEAGIPVLVVVDDPAEASSLVDRLGRLDDWVSRAAIGPELALRAAALLRRREQAGVETRAATASNSTLPADSQFFALVVHDLRTPLNVIGLSLRMISQSMPKGEPELEEDLRFVDENYRQIERMLAQLSDFYRLFEPDSAIAPTPFSPRRLVDELLEARASKPEGKNGPVVLDLQPTCPEEVELDPFRARQAIQYVLANASAASGGDPIRLSLRGERDRWIIEAAIDKPAPSSVQSVALTPRSFERLCGFAAERRGMDLAIAAKVSELFGGSARLDVIQDHGTRVVLDWPVKVASP